jgi:hypothetical protein
MERIVFGVRTVFAPEQHNVTCIALDYLEAVPGEVEIDVAATKVSVALYHHLVKDQEA